MKRLGLSLIGLCILAGGGQLSAQHIHEMATSNSVSMLSGGIDGAKTPELIPDATAYRVFFRALTSDGDRVRQVAFLKAANLSESDLRSTLSVSQAFQTMRTQFIAHARAMTSKSVNAVDFTAERDAIGTTMQSLASSELSKEGYMKLNAYIQSEKRKMIMFPEPSMTSQKADQ